MGNRAVIRTTENDLGVYLHWNGGIERIQAYLDFCKASQYRAPENDCYGWAYLCQVICNSFGNGLSVGIDVVNRLDCNNGDNGVYIIEDWEIIGREHANDGSFDEEEYSGFMYHLNNKQPVECRLSDEAIKNIVSERILKHRNQ